MLLMRLAFLLLCIGATAVQAGERPKEHYDESRVPDYTLPDPLTDASGKAVTSPEQWYQSRRPEILGLFETHMYGKAPGRPAMMRFEVVSVDRQALDGKATRKLVTIHLTDRADGPHIDLLIYLPNGVERPTPTFLGLNFGGNHTISDDPEVPVTDSWVRDRPPGNKDHRATEEGRGRASSRWPLQRILQRGYGLATAYYGDIDPDYDNFQDGVHPLFYENGQTQPADDQWGAIAAWGWGLSRIMDYLQSEDDVDHQHVALMGHSRLGKTALWAGAVDPRFVLVISNNSGCGGAALSRREFGETVWRINDSFPHWFNDNFAKYNERVSELPIDQHMLIALIAPRPVLVCSAEEDLHADPRGEFLAAKNADSVYRLLGTDGMQAEKMPALNEPVMSTIGYHIRPGRHDVTDIDWGVYLDFADKHFAR